MVRLFSRGKKSVRSVKPVEPRMYVIVRKDLDPVYRTVQGAHAVAEYAIKHHNKFIEWNNSTLIFLSCFLEKNIRDIHKELKDTVPAKGKRIHIAEFFEPDQNMQLTAIAVYEDGSGHVSRILRKLPLA